MPLKGRLVIGLAAGPDQTLSFASQVVGLPSGGSVSVNTTTPSGPLRIALAGGPFATGPFVITDVRTTVISVNGETGVGLTLQPSPGAAIRTLSTGGGFVSTNGGETSVTSVVTISGTNNLVSASQSGTVTLVAPLRIDTSGSGVTGKIPGMVRTKFVFIPEPGLNLLVATAIGVLALIGRSRLKRR
jgi:hypothetical protein